MMTYGVIRMDLPPVFPIPLCKLAPHPKYALRHRTVLASCLAQTAHPANDKQTWAEIHSLHINRSCNNRPSLGHCTRAECSSIGSSRLFYEVKMLPLGCQFARHACLLLLLAAVCTAAPRPNAAGNWNVCIQLLKRLSFIFIFLFFCPTWVYIYLILFGAQSLMCIRVCSVQWQWSATFLISIDVT